MRCLKRNIAREVSPTCSRTHLTPGPDRGQASRHSASDAPRPGATSYLRTPNRRVVTGPEAVLLTGSRSNAGRAHRRGERRTAAEQDGHDVDHDLVNEPAFQALAGEVSAEYLDVLAACRLHGRGDRSLDVTGQEGDRWIARSLRGPVGEHELRSLPSAFVGFAGWLPGIALTYLVGPPAREDGTGRHHDFRCLTRGRILKHPVHAVTGPRDEAVQRHRAVHDHLPGCCASIAHEVPSIAADRRSFRRARIAELIAGCTARPRPSVVTSGCPRCRRGRTRVNSNKSVRQRDEVTRLRRPASTRHAGVESKIAAVLLKGGTNAMTTPERNPDALPDSSDPSGPCPWCGRVSNFTVSSNNSLNPMPGHSSPMQRVSTLACQGCGKGIAVVEDLYIGETRHARPGTGQMTYRGFHWLANSRISVVGFSCTAHRVHCLRRSCPLPERPCA